MKSRQKSKNSKVKQQLVVYTTATKNAYSSLATDTDPQQQPVQLCQPVVPKTALATHENALTKKEAQSSRHQRRAARRRHVKETLQRLKEQEELFFDNFITIAEDERTSLAKGDTKNAKKQKIEDAHKPTSQPALSLMQRGRNASYSVGTSFKRAVQKLRHDNQRVRFASANSVAQFNSNDLATAITFDSGADGHYISERDRCKAGLPILHPSTKRVGVANGGTSKAKFVTRLPFKQLSNNAAKADTFQDFPTSLMSVGKTCDDGNISIFTDAGVSVYKEQDVLITCQNEPILIGVRDEHGRYRIPLIQQRGQMQPRAPSKKAKKALRQANSVYDLPSIEQAIKWMHAVCGYPVKSTWLKAIKAGNFIGWPLLTTANVKKYYPETDETHKGHMNQARKNVRSTKVKSKPLETCNTDNLRGKKARDVYTKVYDVRNTMFSDQTGQFPKRSKRGNKYIMVMVEIDSNAILVEPMKSRKDAEMIRAYSVLMSRLKRAGIIPKKHILDNEISENMKNIIRDDCNMEIELVPPGCHRRNAAEVAIRNFKAHFLSVLAGVSDDFPLQLWDRLLPQAEITLNLLRQSNATPTVSAYAHMSGPFDYNKMPLAPMGCEAQVHEKTDKRGTWAYHSVDGWYLYTSPEHYRTHACHIKATRSERLTDTVQFKHKHITNPTVTNADKLMQAMADCVSAIKRHARNNSSQELQELQRAVESKQHEMKNAARVGNPPLQDESPSPPPQTHTLPRVQPVPRVDEDNGDSRRITRSMSADREQATAMPRQPSPRVPIEPTAQSEPPPPTSHMAEITARLRKKERRRRRQRAARVGDPPLQDDPPAANTRSKTLKAAEAAAPPAARTRSRRRRESGIQQPTRTPSKRIHLPEQAAAAILQRKKKKRIRRLTRQITRLENEVHQAMAVMDADSGKMLNYRQLMRNPKYRKQWSISSANELGRFPVCFPFAFRLVPVRFLFAS